MHSACCKNHLQIFALLCQCRQPWDVTVTVEWIPVQTTERDENTYFLQFTEGQTCRSVILGAKSWHPSRVRWRDSKQRPLDCESSAVTTRLEHYPFTSEIFFLELTQSSTALWFDKVLWMFKLLHSLCEGSKIRKV